MMDESMTLVSIAAAKTTLSTATRKSRWERRAVLIAGKRWGSETDKPFLPPSFTDLPHSWSPQQVEQFLREQRLEELTRKTLSNELEFPPPDIRPPSPAPVYDKMGTRMNTTEVRIKEAMQKEYQGLINYMTEHLKGYVPPSDFKRVKLIRRIIIPTDTFPEYNFMGLIIGPRGCNHRRLESESACLISIRGRGTQKEGRKSEHQTDEESAMPMHVHIAADNDDSLDTAVSLIEPLLDPTHPEHEAHKRKGLEQLALVNGVNYTLDNARCAVCQGIGHMANECPDASELQPFKKATVVCAICGDRGHVTMDCKFTMDNAPDGPRHNPVQIDEEYRRMMAEIGTGLQPGSTAAAEAAAQSGQAIVEHNGANGNHGTPAIVGPGPDYRAHQQHRAHKYQQNAAHWETSLTAHNLQAMRIKPWARTDNWQMAAQANLAMQSMYGVVPTLHCAVLPPPDAPPPPPSEGPPSQRYPG